MKLAVIGPTSPWRGGIAHYTTRLIPALEEHDHRVTLVNFRRLYPNALFPGRRQTDLSGVPFDVPNARILAPLAPLSWLRTIQHVVESGAERLILQWWHPFFAPAYRVVATAASLAGIDIVFQCHNVEPHESTIFDDALLNLAYGAGNMFVVQSRPERRRLARRVGRDIPIQVAPHPPYDHFESNGRSASDWREALDAGQHDVVLFFGLVRPYKGLEILLEAAKHLSDERDFVLVVAGEHYEERGEYEAQITRLGIGDRVRLHDAYVPNEDVAGLFALADVCVLPYRHATGSGVANIAVSHDVPLVMSDLPDLRDAFGDVPRWFPTGDARSMARCIEDALADTGSTHADITHGWNEVVEALTAPIDERGSTTRARR